MSSEVEKILREMWACDHFTGKQTDLIEDLIDAKIQEALRNFCDEKGKHFFPAGGNGCLCGKYPKQVSQ